jgi:transposase
MQVVTTIGLDIAKSVFQVHGVDAAGQVLIRRQLKRRAVLAFFQKLPVCLVGIEACASSHYWSRELQALGHSVRLMPPAYVKPYVKRQKNDMAGKHFRGVGGYQRAMISTPVLESRLPVGSSARRIDGLLTRARATATRFSVVFVSITSFPSMRFRLSPAIVPAHRRHSHLGNP